MKKMTEEEIGNIASAIATAGRIVKEAQAVCRHPYSHVHNEGSLTPYMCCTLCGKEGIGAWEYKGAEE